MFKNSLNEVINRKIVFFEWDKGNELKNKLKHNVAKKEIEQIFFDKPVYLNDLKHSLAEKRYFIFGETEEKRLLIIVFTVRTKLIRVISARNMDKKEKYFYQLKSKLYEKKT